MVAFQVENLPTAGVRILFVTNVTSLLQLLVNSLDVLVQVGYGESLATIRAL